ncbi:MAG: DNA mismatch repair protein MutS [Anaerolineae bacterium]|nr:DNA mismatch repair protein MutS [Anaerolineae bacterium]
MAKSTITPVRRQYLDIKSQYPDTIVFFRLGDFYETFDQDAEVAARELDLVLTSRPVSKHQRVPMAGIPYHAVENYVARLIEKGYHVAICEQMGTTPINGLVPREVTRVITPGTVIEPGLLAERRNNYLLAVYPERDKHGSWTRAGLAYVDITTGEFAATQLEGEQTPVSVMEELARLAPREVIFPQSWAERGITLPPGSHLTPFSDWHFETGNARQALLSHFGIRDLHGFDLESRPLAVNAAGAILQYLADTQRNALRQLATLRAYSTESFMLLDRATRRNLELTETIRTGETQGSLLGVLDRTVTPMGGRLLRRWLGQPLLDLKQLVARQDAIEALFQHVSIRNEVLATLKGVADLERLTNRVIGGNAGPRDLVALRQSLEAIPALRALIVSLPALASLHDALDPSDEVADLIRRAIADDPPATLNTIGVIRPGYSPELDGIHASSRDAKAWVASLESVERERTGIKTLKVGFNKVFGYYIEISKAQSKNAPSEYIRKQTLVNSERYITPELKEYESLILNAEERILEVESRLFREVLQVVASHSDRLLRTANALAHLDVFAALAEVAAREGYTRPTLTEDDVLIIRQGRHPVVEKLLREERYVPNDVTFDADQRLLIITGPNMSGKSTFIRQVALITLMAQIGSFVPAESATIGLVDRIFTRIGAQDEIHAGQSTFMVEMVETARILSGGTRRSLVILDEVGRGTSTYDGMAIARAVVEYLHNSPHLGCKTLFATHYHELTELANILPRVRNYNVAVAEEGDNVVFLHKVLPGGANRSYGIHVAKLAGIPKGVINRANEILAELEEAGSDFTIKSRQPGAPTQLSLFSIEPPEVIRILRELKIDELTPLDAITKLYELKRLATEES